MLGLVRRVAGLASWVPAEPRERERGPGKAVGGRGAGSRGWRGMEESASRRKEETMKRRNNMNTVAGMALQYLPRHELVDH